jgi:hypothetical protein
VADNFIAQNTNPANPGYYDDIFLVSSMGGPVADFRVNPEGDLAASGAGASLLYS